MAAITDVGRFRNTRRIIVLTGGDKCPTEDLGEINFRLKASVLDTATGRVEIYPIQDFELVQHNSNSGKVYYKQHPLWNEPHLRNSAFYIDLGHLRWRYLTDHDTQVQQSIQANDAMIRKDQYVTVGGPDIAFAEAHMFVDNLGGITN